MSIPNILVIVGPTAVGKTALALELAKKHGGEVVSADSRQVYKEMSVGTGKPAGAWQPYAGSEAYFVDTVPHFGLDLFSPDSAFSVADYKKYAYQKIDEILSRGKLPIIVGGTGLYIWALVDNLDLNAAEPNQKLRAELESLDLETLLVRLQKVDPDGFNFVDKGNKRRVIRALEIAESENQGSIAAQSKLPPLYDSLQIGLTMPREELVQKIDARIDDQIANGFKTEAEVLFKKYSPDLPSMSSIGYSQWGAFFRGELTEAEATQAIKIATHRYAKKQMTWFKRDKKIIWFSPNDCMAIERALQTFLKN